MPVFPSSLASGNVPVQYQMLAGGFVGTDQTVAKMRDLATGRWGSRSPKIRALAINILRQAGIPEKNYLAETIAIHNWVRDNIRYTKDVAGQETLCPPEEIAFNSKAGDCDDKAMLEAALLGAVGTITRFKVLGVTPEQYSHVYLQAMVGGRWISLDPIMRDKPAGWEAPAVMRAIEKVYPENIPQGTPMNGLNGLGYVGDPRIVSHLEAEPVDPTPSRTPYVQMRSFLDNDAPIEQLSNQEPAFHMQANIPQRMSAGRARQLKAQLRDIRGKGAAAQAMQDEADVQAAMAQARNPGRGLNDVMLPEQLAAMGANIMDAQPTPFMQRPALVAAPEGIDVAFGRNALVMRGDRGDRIEYRGLWAANEKPPIRRVGGVAGYAPNRGMLPSMGYLANQSLSGPGLGEDVPMEQVYADPAPAPAPSKLPLLGLLAIAAGAYLLLRKK